jgi:hypothetical protein
MEQLRMVTTARAVCVEILVTHVQEYQLLIEDARICNCPSEQSSV